MNKFNLKLLKRFNSKVKKTSLCWNWIAFIAPDGYGRFWFLGKNIPAHVMSYKIHNGKISKNKQIDHLCRNRKCVNPKHLEQVSAKVNIMRGVGLTALNNKKKVCPKCHGKFSLDRRGHRYCKKCRLDHYYINRTQILKKCKEKYKNEKSSVS